MESINSAQFASTFVARKAKPLPMSADEIEIQFECFAIAANMVWWINAEFNHIYSKRVSRFANSLDLD